MLQEENGQLIRELCGRLNSTWEPGEGEQQHRGAFLKPFPLRLCAPPPPFLPLNSQNSELQTSFKDLKIVGEMLIRIPHIPSHTHTYSDYATRSCCVCQTRAKLEPIGFVIIDGGVQIDSRREPNHRDIDPAVSNHISGTDTDDWITVLIQITQQDVTIYDTHSCSSISTCTVILSENCGCEPGSPESSIKPCSGQKKSKGALVLVVKIKP